MRRVWCPSPECQCRNVNTAANIIYAKGSTSWATRDDMQLPTRAGHFPSFLYPHSVLLSRVAEYLIVATLARVERRRGCRSSSSTCCSSSSTCRSLNSFHRSNLHQVGRSCRRGSARNSCRHGTRDTPTSRSITDQVVGLSRIESPTACQRPPHQTSVLKIPVISNHLERRVQLRSSTMLLKTLSTNFSGNDPRYEVALAGWLHV